MLFNCLLYNCLLSIKLHLGIWHNVHLCQTATAFQAGFISGVRSSCGIMALHVWPMSCPAALPPSWCENGIISPPPQPHGHSLLSTHLGQQAGILGGDLTYLLKATVHNSNLNANRFDQFVFNSEIYIHRFDSLGCLLDCSNRRRNVGDEEPSICIGGAKCCRPIGGCVELPRGRCSWRLCS